ncbi:MAG: ABC transporter ATP-binding protein [Acidobacteria bacterium]|nr:ABC transporter ATP-binding protein [Acidobacteriota bacterium]
MEYIVEIKDLSKDYETGFWRKKKARALDGLTLNVRPGQIFGFLGGNGAGKTTTIKILMSLLFPTEGSAKILGRDISDVSMHSRIGYCPENPYFYDYLTANELMDYFGQIFGYDAAKRKQLTDELLTAVGLEEKSRNRQLRKFSKGMQQRVGLAQALINDPEIVFLDEPMSGLDPVGRREIRELIVSLREKGKTVFMSTHILSDVEALCDEVAILRGGRLSATGSLSDLLSTGNEQRAFELLIGGVASEQMRNAVSGINGAEVLTKPAGTAIEVLNESDIDAAIVAARSCGGKIISINPVSLSLEDLFVAPKTSQTED